MSKYILEVCADSVESSIAADQAGADRLELCSNLMIGGTTPGSCLFNAVRKYCDIKIHVLIRPRYGDFCYTDYEYEVMKEEVKLFRDMGADGLVIGILKPDGNLDIERMEGLMESAKGIPFTLHRAFDMCADPFRALEEAKLLGFKTILTSGQQNKCSEGQELIQRLVELSKGDLDILVGGGVDAGVIQQLAPFTKASAYHMSGKRILEGSMEYRKVGISMGLPGLSEYQLLRTSKTEIMRASEVLKKLQ